MLTVVIGLTSALVFGAADFLGGLAAKRMHAALATGISGFIGLLVMLLALPLLGGAWSPEAVVLGALSGISGSIAIGLLYACLAIGPMSILSPLTAVVSAIVPVTVSLIGGERLGALGYVALGLAAVAIVLVGFVPEKHAVRPSLKGVLMAVASGIAIGGFLLIIDRTPEDSGIVPLVFNRGMSALIMFSVVGVLLLAARRRDRLAPLGSERSAPLGAVRAGLRFALACGVVDAIANIGLLLGVRLGDLSVMAVLTALYPAGTIILAAIVLKERIAWLQYVGLALAVVAGAMLALS